MYSNLIYGVAQSVENQNEILVCQAKENSNIEILTDDDGNYLTDDDGYYLTT